MHLVRGAFEMGAKFVVHCGVGAPRADDMKCLHVECKYEEPRGLYKSDNSIEKDEWFKTLARTECGCISKHGAIFN